MVHLAVRKSALDHNGLPNVAIALGPPHSSALVALDRGSRRIQTRDDPWGINRLLTLSDETLWAELSHSVGRGGPWGTS